MGEELNEGQIEQISHNMLIDKVCEEYQKFTCRANVPCKSIAFQSLQRKVSNAKASVVYFSMTPIDGEAKS
jgi:hypothetical protein